MVHIMVKTDRNPNSNTTKVIQRKKEKKNECNEMMKELRCHNLETTKIDYNVLVIKLTEIQVKRYKLVIRLH